MALFKLTKRDRNNKLREVGSIEIRNQTDESADLCFFGDINSESLGEWQKYYPEDKAPSDVKDFLDQLENVSKINVHINSGGGSVFGGIAIYNMLKRFDAEITVYVEGLAASIAWGNADEMRKEADILDGCQKVILNTYMQHVKEGITEDTINDLINAETWKNGVEWQEYFDIEVSESSQAVAAASDFYDAYKHTPKNLAAKQETDEKLTAEKIAAAVISAIKDNFTGEEPQEPPKEPENDLERKKAEILEDLDYI